MRGAGLQNAMTSSEERTSAEAEGYRIERSLMDCVAPVSKGGDAIHQCPRADSWLLRGVFDHWSVILFYCRCPFRRCLSFLVYADMVHVHLLMTFILSREIEEEEEEEKEKKGGQRQ